MTRVNRQTILGRLRWDRIGVGNTIVTIRWIRYVGFRRRFPQQIPSRVDTWDFVERHLCVANQHDSVFVVGIADRIPRILSNES